MHLKKKMEHAARVTPKYHRVDVRISWGQQH